MDEGLRGRQGVDLWRHRCDELHGDARGGRADEADLPRNHHGPEIRRGGARSALGEEEPAPARGQHGQGRRGPETVCERQRRPAGAGPRRGDEGRYGRYVRHEGEARCGADGGSQFRLAYRQTREVERHRGGEGRPDAGRRRRTDEPHRLGGDRPEAGACRRTGQTINGAQNIFFAQLADPNTTKFSVDATRFMAGKFPFMMFGLPGAALAMYRCARNEKKKVVGGLLLSAALTAFLTGITEPLEFTFLFVAPILYVVHCVLAGISFMLMHIFGVGVGMTFSGGLIDMTLFGIMQGNAKTHWIYIVLVGIVYFFVYWGVFTFLIKKFNFKTPGREADNEETKLYTRSDVNAKNGGKTDMTSVLILKGLGGKENIADIDCCATRLRITVHNSDAVSEDILKQSGAAGVIKKGNGIQVIYGPRVTVIKSHLEDFMESKESVDLSGYGVADNEIQTEKETAPKADGTEIFLSSPIRGKAVPLEKVDDEVFSAGILGQGIAIEPSEGKVFAPVDGVVENIPKSKHAIAITADNDANILIHVGLDTVELDGNGFDVKVANGAKIKKGDLLMTFNLSGIKKQGYKMITPMVVCNADEFAEFKTVADGDVNVGDDVIRIVR